MHSLLNIFYLGVKELRSLGRDTMMLIIIAFAFSGQIYVVATGIPESLHKAPIAIVDEDRSQLSQRLVNAFYSLRFLIPVIIDPSATDPGMDKGLYTFVQHHRADAILPVEPEVRVLFNPNLSNEWFGSVMELINSITALSLIFPGAALTHEREHGTIEHLLVMPLTPFEIMMAKVWPMGLVVVLMATASFIIVVQGWFDVPIQGSIALFVLGMAMHLFATTSLGILLSTVARSMPQLGLLMVITLLPLRMLSGGMTPFESMPDWVQKIMQVAPTTLNGKFTKQIFISCLYIKNIKLSPSKGLAKIVAINANLQQRLLIERAVGMTRTIFAFPWLLIILVACTPILHHVEPYRGNVMAAYELEQHAARMCIGKRGTDDQPPHRFTTDGCSMWPNGTWTECCVEHDIAYWCGGSAEDREHVDSAFRQCVSESRSTCMGTMMYIGVRIGGVPWQPFPWRWGYGWNGIHGYDDSSTGKKQ